MIFTNNSAFKLDVRGDVLEGRTLEGIQDEDVSLGWSESGDLLLLHPDRRESALRSPGSSGRRGRDQRSKSVNKLYNPKSQYLKRMLTSDGCPHLTQASSGHPGIMKLRKEFEVLLEVGRAFTWKPNLS